MQNIGLKSPGRQGESERWMRKKPGSSMGKLVLAGISSSCIVLIPCLIFWIQRKIKIE